MNDFNRPKTSRGKQRPSPDEFTDYIIPSPLNIRNNSNNMKNNSSDYITIHSIKNKQKLEKLEKNERNERIQKKVSIKINLFIFI